MNALIVEELFDLLGNLHVLGQIAAAYVRWGDDSVAGQLPHVELVDGQNAVNVFQQPLLNGIDLGAENKYVTYSSLK